VKLTSCLCLCLGLALLSTSCLTPPGYPGTKNAAAAPPKTAPGAAPVSLGDFSRSSPELLATLRPGWNLGNSLDVPDGETKWGNPGQGFSMSEIDGRTFVFVPDATWSTTTVFELDRGQAHARFTVPGIVSNWVRVR
jgi:hypothetical protein